MNQAVEELLPPLPDERLALIRARLESQGRVLAGDLARDFATSEDTIRRDLRQLAKAGLCRRVYGGALPMSAMPAPLRLRETQAGERKARLGIVAARLAWPGAFLFLDAGSTNLAIARALPDNMRLTVATNALAIAAVIEAKPAIDLIILGGRYDRATGSALGATTIRAAERLRPDLYFVGACALDRMAGLSVFDAEEAELKRTLVDVSVTVAAAVTDEKLGTAAPHRVAPWAALAHLVVETGWRGEEVAEAGAAGPVIHVALAPETAR